MNHTERSPAGGLPASGPSNPTRTIQRPAKEPRVAKPAGPARPLAAELGSLVRLRWGVACGVLLAAGLAHLGRGWVVGPEQANALAAVGGVIFAYNAALWLTLRRLADGRPSHAVGLVRSTGPGLPSLAWAQLLLDLGSLTVLTVLTGGTASPVLGFFVFHMVFASLLLPRRTAYGSAVVAMLFLAVGLWTTGRRPTERGEAAALLAWGTTLVVTVWLANGITRRLREQRRRLARQNRRIRAMARSLRRHQRALVQHEKMAVAGRMAAGVAHEIANPLASMDGLLQLMERRPDKPRPQALGTLREQVSRINQIVRRMTAFAHPGEGQWQVGSLNDIVEKALDVLRFDPRIKHLSVERHLAADLPPVRMVPEAVQQVIINLVANATDAIEQTPQPRLGVRTYRSGGWCALEVSDNGHGIPVEHRKRLFEPFFTTKPVGKGTGLGLSISYTLVKNHGGQIDADSAPGRGTRFTVRLPTANNEAAEPAAVIPQASSRS